MVTIGDGPLHDDELVAAEAVHGLAFTGGLGEPIADPTQETITGLMAERVVDLLEALEVDEEQRHLLADRLGGVEHRRDVRASDGSGVP